MQLSRRQVVTAAVVAAVGVTVVGISAVPGWHLVPRFDFTLAPLKGGGSLPVNTRMPSRPVMPSGGPMLGVGAVHAIRTVALVVLITIGALIAAVIVWRLWPRHLERPERLPDAPEHIDLEVGLDQAVRQARSYLQLHRETGDVAKGITLAWSALEQLAADSGHVRQDNQTASEFTARLLRDVTGSPGDEIGELLGLYHRARFGDPATVASLTLADLDRADELLGGLSAEFAEAAPVSPVSPGPAAASPPSAGSGPTGGTA